MRDGKHKETDRIGLYLMVFFIMVFGPCGSSDKKTQNKLLKKVDAIEIKIDRLLTDNETVVAIKALKEKTNDRYRNKN